MKNKIKTEAELRQEDLERISRLRLLDDDFLVTFFTDNIEDTETLLRTILDKKDLKVKSVQTQRPIRNLVRRSLALDIYAEDEDGARMDVEIQRASAGASPKRARFHSSMMDVDAMRKRADWKELPESFVIFITETDVLHAGQPIYHIDRHIRETDSSFEDEAHIIYVNGANDEDTDLGKMMHDFRCTSAEELYNRKWAEKFKYYKESEEGVKKMSSVLDEMKMEAVWQEKAKSVFRWLAMGVSVEDIAKGEDLPVEEVKEIIEQNSALMAGQR
ncbi:MAG: PD-(D/E)XK nuclease family transposase [Lachnospiraceae bacterium]|nr:PD-(D/E)XK nuclease family transposase [Lachnospiraceae bacterium]